MARDAVRLTNMAFYGHHGTKKAEEELGARFTVDLVMRADLSRAGASDKLADTVDYQRAFEIVRGLVEGKRFYLLEALGEAIAGAVLKEFAVVDEVEVRVRKPGVPIKGILDHAEVEVVRGRASAKR